MPAVIFLSVIALMYFASNSSYGTRRFLDKSIMLIFFIGGFLTGVWFFAVWILGIVLAALVGGDAAFDD